MRTIFILLRKEFLQVFRNKGMLPIIFIMPVVQLLVLSNAANYEVKDLAIHVVDNDLSGTSRKIISKMEGSGYFKIYSSSFSENVAMNDLKSDKVDLIVQFPPHFEKDLNKNNKTKLQVIVNSINGAKAGLAFNYSSSIIADFNNQVRIERLNLPEKPVLPEIEIRYSNWFNPTLDYKTFMVPGILVMLVTMIGLFLSGMNIVREKEIGTIEQLNVTPIKKYQFIIGKLLPFWIIALMELVFGLALGKLFFGIPMVGSLPLVFAFAAIYLLVVLGMGMFISTFADTQQQAMFISWFFTVIFILMSGLFTPIESMPEWAQKLTLINPISYFVEVMRMVLLKGSGFLDIKWHFLAIVVYAIIINSLAIYNYKKINN